MTNQQDQTPQLYPTGIPLPSLPLQPGLFLLDYMQRVLPAQGEAISRFNRGWTYSFAAIQQVEVLTMVVAEDCDVVSIGFANPVEADQMAFVESVSLYKGRNAADSLVEVHQGYEQLAGGRQVLSYIHLRTPFRLPAHLPMTIKVKLGIPASSPITSLLLYRGNPFDRPDIWRGSDGLCWEFKETEGIRQDETRRSLSSVSGPILRFIYKY